MFVFSYGDITYDNFCFFSHVDLPVMIVCPEVRRYTIWQFLSFLTCGDACNNSLSWVMERVMFDIFFFVLKCGGSISMLFDHSYGEVVWHYFVFVLTCGDVCINVVVFFLLWRNSFMTLFLVCSHIWRCLYNIMFVLTCRDDYISFVW